MSEKTPNTSLQPTGAAVTVFPTFELSEAAPAAELVVRRPGDGCFDDE